MTLKGISTLALAAIMAVSFGFSAASAATFTDNFNAGLDPSFWSVAQTTAALYSLDTTHGDIRLAKVANNPGGIQSISVNLNLAALGGNISGDFSMQIGFTNASIGPHVDQVELHSIYADSSVFFDVRDNSSGDNVHVWNGSAIHGATPFAPGFGTFQISRTGSTVTGTINGTTIYSESHASPLTTINFILQNQPGSDDFPSVTFDNFSLTAASVPEPSTLALLSAALPAWLACRRRRRTC